ncbi:hypothetical protein ZWY2020_023155 [Hordeum vulgare]|nr:hypothetical protein ZWY2020_023155 [Hordeum vulgare]
MTELSPRASSWHVDDHMSFGTAHSSPHSHSHSHNASAAMTEAAASDLPFPSYMSNTETSRAKARSQSAPRQRAVAEALERQPSRRKGAEHRSVSRGARMQRDSECGSTTSSVLTAATTVFRHFFALLPLPNGKGWFSFRSRESVPALFTGLPTFFTRHHQPPEEEGKELRRPAGRSSRSRRLRDATASRSSALLMRESCSIQAAKVLGAPTTFDAAKLTVQHAGAGEAFPGAYTRAGLEKIDSRFSPSRSGPDGFFFKRLTDGTNL